jgi:hypothetical protein
MATMRDLRAAEARETTAEAASVVSGINRIGQHMAEAVGSQMTATLLAPNSESSVGKRSFWRSSLAIRYSQWTVTSTGARR